LAFVELAFAVHGMAPLLAGVMNRLINGHEFFDILVQNLLPANPTVS
jgi:hypothetical protein